MMLALLLLVLAATPPLFDGEAKVLRVVDGDTLVVDLRPISRFSGLAGEQRIRLADINAPELSTPEGRRSAEALRVLLEGKTIYIDIDDKHVNDRYGRLVALVFLTYNETHLMNVNMWLVKNGYAQLWDHDNEFSPASWTLFVRIEGSSASSSEESPTRYIAIIVAVALIAVLALAIMRK